MPQETASPPHVLSLPITSLRESATNPRKTFDPKKLEELTASIAQSGILQPLLVRRSEAEEGFEIIAGARRYRAGMAAGLAEVPVIERQLSDGEVFRVQLAENMERDDLTPSEEAEAYGLLREQGHDVAAIAKIVNRKAGDVAKRLGLLELPKKVRDALSAGVLPVAHAELIGRIPDAGLQSAALARILESNYYDGSDKAIAVAIPYAVAKRIIEQEFMTALAAAVFDPEDAALSPLGRCSTCVHLAGNNRDLFGDVQGKNVCTNPKDFHLKVTNHLKQLEERGFTVLLSPKQVERAYPKNGMGQLSREFVDLEHPCLEDRKGRTYDELLGSGEKLKTVFALKDGRVRRLFPAKELGRALSASGHRFVKDRQEKPKGETVAARSAAQLEEVGRNAVRRALATNLRTLKLTPGGWIDLLLRIVLIVEGWRLESVIVRHGVTVSPEHLARNREKLVADRLAAMTDAEKRAFLVDLLMGDWISSKDKAEVELYKHVLRLADVNLAEVTNAAIEAAKREATLSKKTPKPPIAAQSVAKKRENRGAHV